MVFFTKMETTIFGTIYIVANSEEIIDISLTEEDWLNYSKKNEVKENRDLPILNKAVFQLTKYFEGNLKEFTVPLKVEGTPFRKSVWLELQKIPYGSTKSYAEIAKLINNEKAVRAVGQANRSNPIPIIIPCHRVIGKNKTLTGYSGTRTDLKEKLLQLEGVNL